MLARAGVGRLRLADFDVIKPSNINRQLYALGSTLGRTKASVAAGRVKDINPDCEVEPLELFASSESLNPGRIATHYSQNFLLNRIITI